jgi:hypothetical protein
MGPALDPSFRAEAKNPRAKRLVYDDGRGAKSGFAGGCFACGVNMTWVVGTGERVLLDRWTGSFGTLHRGRAPGAENDQAAGIAPGGLMHCP